MFLSILSASLSHPAHAEDEWVDVDLDDCETDAAPDEYEDFNCNSICYVRLTPYPLEDLIFCEMGPAWTSGDATLYAVTDFEGSGVADFSFWGINTQGNEFCCSYDDVSGVEGSVYKINIYGANGDDDIYLSSADGALDVGPHGSLEVYAYGSDGEDFFAGSYASSGYEEYLYGGSGPDTVYALDGNDYIEGGSGTDYLRGGIGVDTIWGDDGADTLYGDSGDDYINGGAGLDDIWGGSDDDEIWGAGGSDEIDGESGIDEIYGGLNDDTICGGSENDTMYGNEGDDIIFGDVGTSDYADGGPEDDSCSAETRVGCLNYILGVPDFCE